MDARKSLPSNTGLFINGAFRAGSAGRSFKIYDPRDDSELISVAQAEADDVDAAVAAARAALPVWAAVTALEKSRLLNKLADLIEANADDLAMLESLNLGKPISESKGDIICALQTYRYFAGWTDKITGDVMVPGDGFTTQWLKVTQNVPIGVVGHLVPWNYPIVELAKYIAPCLAAGAVSVYKTNEWTPLTVIRTMELFAQAGFPPGVLNVVHGGVGVGEMITRHMDVDKVVFTGSVRAGRAIAIAAAESNLKATCLELGGKSAHIVCPDVEDLDAVAANVLHGFTSMMGQCCCAGTRVLVHETIHDALLAKVAALARKLVVGDPLEPSTQQGPLCNPTQLGRVLEHIERAKAECRLATGGRRIGTTGNFVEPTIFADVPRTSALAKEEVFGPVGAFLRFSSLQDVVALANDTNYALAAGIWTRDLDAAMGLATQLQAGTVWVNGMMTTWGYNTPFGGGKLTGGGRTNGKEGLMQYLVPRSINVKMPAAAEIRVPTARL